MRDALFLSGPIGSGKSSLGGALAESLGGRFIEGDDFGEQGKSWIGQNLTVSRQIIEHVLSAWDEVPLVIVARPLRARDWAFFRKGLSGGGRRCWCVSLDADAEGILDPVRGRRFSDVEARRSRDMIDEGYGKRSFSDAVLRADRATFEVTLAELAELATGLLTSRRGSF
ncbi:hypothetical protein SAMN05216548_102267 [Faunimonas pinastri]|uniref:Shikimate kinase n=1 Tax=Faunimonas pinastri TaxID=1855383 RepID=A0A1H9CXS2_9HYPH|nr:hypothetical protein [Faunimonas pinastri]SEQ05348.1 hypothetical protein SAMN05216548_102267 [Faunimonas pinastri]